MRITDVMYDAYRLPDDVPNKRLAGYMENYLALIIAASSTIALLKGDEDGLQQRAAMWERFHQRESTMAARMGRHPMAYGSNLPGAAGRKLSLAGYRLAQKLYRFN